MVAKTLFCQVCPNWVVLGFLDLPHEANSEQLFSRSGALSDDNGKMDPHRLAVWTSIGVNYSTYKPTDKEILERYMLKFSKGGKASVAELHKDDLGLLDPTGDAEGYLVHRLAATRLSCETRGSLRDRERELFMNGVLISGSEPVNLIRIE